MSAVIIVPLVAAVHTHGSMSLAAAIFQVVGMFAAIIWGICYWRWIDYKDEKARREKEAIDKEYWDKYLKLRNDPWKAESRASMDDYRLSLMMQEKWKKEHDEPTEK